MKSKMAILALVWVCVWGREVRSDTLHFPVDPANTGVVITKLGATDLSSFDLNGTAVAGQSLSLDLLFSNGVLARLGASDPADLSILFIVDTNAGTFPGFAGPTTGFLLDANGSQIGLNPFAGRSMSSDGSFAVGFSLYDLGIFSAVDISGIHIDTSFPDTSGTVVSGAKLAFVNESPFDSVEFGTKQQLPEPSTLLLLGIGILSQWLRPNIRKRLIHKSLAI
jgi:hypothetical protein